MNFFKLTHSIQPSEVGTTNAVIGQEADDTRSANDNFFVIPLEGKVNSLAKFPVLSMQEKAFWTDYVNSVPSDLNYILISSKLKLLLESFNMDEHQFFPIQVKKKMDSKIRDYFLLRFPYSRTNMYIDWEKSVFGHTTYMWRKLIAEIKFRSFGDFWDFHNKAISEKEHVIVRKLAFLEEDVKFDIFRILNLHPASIGHGIFVSEHLKQSIEANGITGCRFIPISEISQKTLEELNPQLYKSLGE